MGTPIWFSGDDTSPPVKESVAFKGPLGKLLDFEVNNYLVAESPVKIYYSHDGFEPASACPEAPIGCSPYNSTTTCTVAALFKGYLNTTAAATSSPSGLDNVFDTWATGSLKSG